MRADNEQVQELLGGMGTECGRTVVGAKATGLSKFVGKEREGREGEGGEAGRVKGRLLEQCGLVIERVLKGGGGLGEGVKAGDRLVIAAKVYVLSRLLVKSLEDIKDIRLRQDVEAAKKSLGHLRGRLLRRIEKVLDAVTKDDDRENVLKALCAYSLASTSGAIDVLRHLLKVRAQAMALALEPEEGRPQKHTEDVMQGLRLYTRTLLDVQAIVPGRLSQTLKELKSRPLLADPALKKLHALRLDIYERWCGEDMQYFTPFIRHDDLDGPNARDMLAKWAEGGAQALLKGLGGTLGHMNEFKSIMELRTSVLQLWIRDGGKARGFDPEEMQDDMREVINARMLEVLEAKVNKLGLVGSEVKATLETWQVGTTDKNDGLWQEDGYDAALSNGAAPFIEEVVSRLYGRNDAVSKALHSYKAWFHVIDDVKEVVQSLTKQRWDNDYDEVEDEETIEARQQALSKDDPRELQARLDASLDKVFEELGNQLSRLWEGRQSKISSGPLAIYFLRILRDIRRQLPERPSTASFGLDLISPLHNELAIFVSERPIESFAAESLSEQTVLSRPLWEGEPPLPTQPSPGLFEFLRNLHMTMGEAGMDLWSPAAVEVLKKHLDAAIEKPWAAELAKLEGEYQKAKSKDGSPSGANSGEGKDKKADKGKSESGEDSGDGEPEQSFEEVETLHQELKTQWLFDIEYLRRCLGDHSTTMEAFSKTLRAKVDLEAASDARLVKAASAYWERTSLLFGLLA